MAKRTTANEQTEAMRRLSQAAAAWLAGMNARTLRDAADCPRNADGTYSGQELVRWRLSRCAAAPDDDPLLTGGGGGGTSPALEKYREHRAALAGLELNERRGRLVDIDAFAAWWESEVAAPLRRAVENLQRQHGPDAAAIVAKALGRADAVVSTRTQAEHGTETDD